MVCRMSLVELKERKEKGLCYNCNEKFAPGHRCKKLFLIEACTAEEDGDMVMDVESNDEPKTPGKSLHAISGGNSLNTMKVLGSIPVVSTMVLLDSGSSHNFISEGLARKLGLQPTKNQSIRVMVASGDKLTSKGICARIAIKLGMFLTHAIFYILPLEGYDVVMGTHWLRTLREILWDFSKLILKFNGARKEVTLIGLSDKFLEGREMEKVAKRQPTTTGAFIQILAMNGGKITNRTEKEEPEI